MKLEQHGSLVDYVNEKYLQPIDAKGRVLLPKDFRDDFKIRKAEPLYLFPNITEPPYLEIRTQGLWDGYLAALLATFSGSDKKDMYRFVKTKYVRVAPDGQGRIVIPEKLRAICALDDEVLFVNMKKHIEVWNRKHIDTKDIAMSKAFRERSDELF